MKLFLRLLLIVSVIFCFITVAATTRYVDINSTNATVPFLSWETAATNIQDAVDSAISGDVILVSDGIYRSGGRVAQGEYLTNRVVINKPVTVQSLNGPEATVIEGATNADFLSLANIRCVYMTSNATLIGFTVTNGYTDTGGYIEQNGGGIWCQSTSAMISNCLFVNNYANGGGGAVYQGTLNNCKILSNSASLHNLTDNGRYEGGGTYASVLNNCILSGNSARFRGGGAAFGVLNNCVLNNNSSTFGGGAYSATLNNCIVLSNTASLRGGGACVGALSDCFLSWNFSSVDGGGAYSNILNRCILINNMAKFFGGGSYGVTANNSLIVSNTAAQGGGFFGSVVSNCTIVGNVATTVGGGFMGAGSFGGKLFNSIVYFNTAPTNAEISAPAGTAYCCVATSMNGVGNITNEPGFVDAVNGDFRLRIDSPCINSGYNPHTPPGTDLDNNSRISGITVDIGAYEFQSPASIFSYAWAQQYGFPTDGSVDYADSDGDGVLNWQESKAATDPTSSASVLKITSISSTNSGMVISWPSVSTVAYYLQRSGSIMASPPFVTIRSNIIGNGATIESVDTNANTFDQFFYRVGVQ